MGYKSSTVYYSSKLSTCVGEPGSESSCFSSFFNWPTVYLITYMHGHAFDNHTYMHVWFLHTDTVPTTIGTETTTKTSSSSTELQSSENNSNVAIIASSTIVAVVILVTIVLIVTVSVTLKRFRQSKKPQVANNASIAAVEHKRYPDVTVHT